MAEGTGARRDRRPNFHDSRREALTRLARIYGVLELAAISGHADIGTLRSVYYAPRVEELAEKIG